LILGLAGLFYQYKKHRNAFLVTLVLFIMADWQSWFYLNQNPMQPVNVITPMPDLSTHLPSDRLGVMTLYDLLSRITPSFPLLFWLH